MEKALSVKNPWAQLIIWGLKDVENRPRKTNFRGRVLIHSSAIPDARFKKGIPEELKVFWTLSRTNFFYFDNPKNYHNGCILGSVEIVDCVQNHPSKWAEEGSWHWVLKNPEIGSQWDGYPVKGSLGLWNMNKTRIMEKLSKEKLDQLIDSIEINAANLEHIAKSGRRINGTLRVELWRVLLEAWAIGTGHPEEKPSQEIKDMVFTDSYGNVCRHGDVIVIENHYNYSHFNGKKALISWDHKAGMYKFSLNQTSKQDFHGVHSFKKEDQNG